jgi:predicted acetyltransferase
MDHKSVVENLMQPYVHDLSEFADDVLDEDGRFKVGQYFDRFWIEAQRHPFLIHVDGALAGFALVAQLPSDNAYYSMSEFFIARAYRRAGIGRDAAFKAFSAFPGKWRVAQDEGNRPAQTFWRRIIGEYTNGNFVEEWSESQPKGPSQVFTANE